MFGDLGKDPLWQARSWESPIPAPTCLCINSKHGRRTCTQWRVAAPLKWVIENWSVHVIQNFPGLLSGVAWAIAKMACTHAAPCKLPPWATAHVSLPHAPRVISVGNWYDYTVYLHLLWHEAKNACHPSAVHWILVYTLTFYFYYSYFHSFNYCRLIGSLNWCVLCTLYMLILYI